MPSWLAWLILAVVDALVVWGAYKCPPECFTSRKRECLKKRRG